MNRFITRFVAWCAVFSIILAGCRSSGVLEQPILESQSEQTASLHQHTDQTHELTEHQTTPNKHPDGTISATFDGLTPHFRSWLTANGYGGFDFARLSLPGGSYGGKTSNADPIVNEPVIFIHGNSDKASGWNASIDYFLSKGYTRAELYAITWGPADATQSSQQYHSRPYLERIRAFIQAVKQYTGASKVDIITHSMGVTLTRKAIKGGPASDALNGGSYNLGSSLTSIVDTFVGIAGGNWGLVSCYATPGVPTCGTTNGLYPGAFACSPMPCGLSNFLAELNSSSGYEGAYRYSIWSTADQIIGYGGLVYGRYTPQIPSQTGERVFSTAPYGHFGVRDLTGEIQWRMVKFHTTN
jgi:hypothetical protein